ncbi:hypothetical protein [Actinophytocola xinjiangensis]|uniref:hypothetical protein n=1 Tax=Actinophytocola xinjiangensis TaxID=485602 RepID=UPI003CCBC6E1
MPRTEDVRKAGEQAVEVLRMPLLVALGAGDLATQAVRDAVRGTDLAGAYQKLADQGEDTLNKLRSQPQVRRALEQVEEAIAALQARVGDAAGDARELADEVLAKVTWRARSVEAVVDEPVAAAAKTTEHKTTEQKASAPKTSAPKASSRKTNGVKPADK